MAIENTTTRRGWGVAGRMTAAVFVLALGPILTVLWSTLSTSQPQMERLATDNLRGGVQSYRAALEQWEGQNHALGRHAADGLARIAKDDEKAQKEFLQGLVRAAGGSIITAWATDPDGNQTVRDNDGKLSNINERPYFQKARNDGLGGIEVAVSKSTGKYTTLAGYRYQPDFGGLRVLGINWDPSFFAKAADRLSLGRTGKAAVISGEGLFVHTTDAKAGEAAEKSLVARLPSAGETTVFEHTAADGRVWLVAASSDDKRGLRYVVMQAHDEAFGPVDTQKTYATWGASVALAFALVFALYLRRTYAHPVVELANAIRTLSTTSPSALWKLNIPHTSKGDEIGSIARSAQRIQKTLFTTFADKAVGKRGN